MRAQLSLAVFALLAVCSGTFATAQAPQGNVVRLPGLTYEVLRSGSPAGVRPLRSDDVMIRYVGRLEDGSIFSTSSADGMEPTRFSVRTVIPGFSALVQLMRPGDRWRFTIPGYLGYGHEGRRFTPPEATLRRDIPPGSTLIFDVEWSQSSRRPHHRSLPPGANSQQLR
jgi:FKBP-type peptidyl-prolyl cis-trans isomerase FklB